MVKIFIDPGHGGTDPGAAANGLLEKYLTLAISLRIRALLENYENVQVKLSRDDDSTLSLKQRTDMANKWGADYLISVHINAGGGQGYEDWIYNSASSASIARQNVMHAELIKPLGMTDRGKKRGNLHMMRESHMPAILTENGFIDNSTDAAKLKQSAFIDKVAQGHVNGLVKIFGLKLKHKEVDDLLEKAIVIGGFPDFAVAEVLAARLKAPVYTRNALPSGKVAKELYVVGGTTEGLQADKIISLSGKDRFEVASAVNKFLG